MSDEAIAQLLQLFPKVERLILSNLDYTGADFPALAALQVINADNTPISDAGLERILRCPELRVLQMRLVAITAAGGRKIPEWRPKPMDIFWLAAECKTTEADEIEARLKAVWRVGSVIISGKRAEEEQ
jgi:hypothetical protein